MSKKEDVRAVQSKEKIKGAFRKLLQEKGFNKTTVSDIIKLADVNRSTFYAHYTDKFDLLDKFENEAVLKLREASGQMPDNVFESDFIHSAEFREYITSILTLISENKEILMILYDTEHSANFQKKLFAFIDSVWSTHHITENLRFEREYVQVAAVGMVCSLIEKWVKSGCETEMRDFSKIVAGIVGNFAESVLVNK